MIIELPDETPEGWRELILGLVLLSKGATDRHYPTHCEHDTLSVCSDPKQFTGEELNQLTAWGFIPQSDWDGFVSSRFGSA